MTQSTLIIKWKEKAVTLFSYLLAPHHSKPLHCFAAQLNPLFSCYRRAETLLFPKMYTFLIGPCRTWWSNSMEEALYAFHNKRFLEMRHIHSTLVDEINWEWMNHFWISVYLDIQESSRDGELAGRLSQETHLFVILGTQGTDLMRRNLHHFSL